MPVLDQIVSTLYPPGTVERPEKPTSPHARLWQLLIEDRRDLLLIATYTMLSGIFSLSIPLATQTLVNTIAAGVFLQPILLIAFMVLVGLCFVASLRLLTLWLVEKIRQRTFARIALRLGYRVPRIKHAALANEFLPELVNRFFDTITVQSGWFNFLLDVPAAALTVTVGLTLLAIYSPWFLIFDLIVVCYFAFTVLVLGYGGYQTRSNETTQRFRIAEWLEELARCEAGIKMSGVPVELLEHTDQLLVAYVRLRRLQFDVLFRQAAGLYFFQACASAGVLGIGGWLVVVRQLTLGQLVASLLIVNMVLPALERLVRNLQNVYELLSALGKIGYVEDLPLERTNGVQLNSTAGGIGIIFKGVRFSFDGNKEVLRDLNLSIKPGERISIFGPNGCGKTTVGLLLCGLLEPTHGMIEIDGIDVRDFDLVSLRKSVAFVSDVNEIIDGTIEANVSLGRADIDHRDVLWALNLVGLDEELASLPNGLKTEIFSGGRNLSRGQLQKILLARAIVKRPQLLIMDEAFTGIEERTRFAILDRLFAKEHQWTIIDMSQDADTILHSQRIVILDQGRVVESGQPFELVWNEHSELSKLFPHLATLVRLKNRSNKKE